MPTIPMDQISNQEMDVSELENDDGVKETHYDLSDVDCLTSAKSGPFAVKS